MHMHRDIYDESHELYRQTVREFISREVTPHYEAWESAGMLDRQVFKAACAAGIYGLEIPERFGGAAECRTIATAVSYARRWREPGPLPSVSALAIRTI